jgi:hypothetical protein
VPKKVLGVVSAAHHETCNRQYATSCGAAQIVKPKASSASLGYRCTQSFGAAEPRPISAEEAGFEAAISTLQTVLKNLCRPLRGLG